MRSWLVEVGLWWEETQWEEKRDKDVEKQTVIRGRKWGKKLILRTVGMMRRSAVRRGGKKGENKLWMEDN